MITDEGKEFIQKLIEFIKSGKIAWKDLKFFNAHSLEIPGYYIYCEWLQDDKPTVIVYKNPDTPEEIAIEFKDYFIKDLFSALYQQEKEQKNIEEEIIQTIEKIEKK